MSDTRTPLPEGKRLSTREFAAMVGVAPSTPRAWRMRGIGPRHQYIGGRAWYYMDDIDAWLAAGLRVPARSHGGAA